MTISASEIGTMIERLERKTFENDGHHGVFEIDLNPDGPDAAVMLRDVAAERDAAEIEIGFLKEKLASAESERDHLLNRSEHNLGLLVKDRRRAKSAEAELDRLAARVEKLRGYAVHDDDCGVNALLMPRPPLTMQCTCGLSDLLKGSEDGQ